MKSEVKQELKSARKNSSDNGANEPVKTAVKTIDLESNHFAADGVYFKCPLVGSYTISSFKKQLTCTYVHIYYMKFVSRRRNFIEK